ncbi:MAG TPA: hypothetical protein VIK89_06820 [Cytophagaceae bacterium]
MSYVNWQDPGTREIRSTDISGLQEIVSKLERSVGMGTVSETNIPLTEVYISENDRWRIFQAPVGKRNWVSSPAPVIKKDGVVINSGFVIDYGAGAIILATNDTEEHTYTADATYIKSLQTSLNEELAIHKAQTATKEELLELNRRKADQSFVDSQFATIVSGAPRGTYTDLNALREAYPEGTEGVMLVLDDGHWYYWNETAQDWLDGGIYQATGIDKESVFDILGVSNSFPVLKDRNLIVNGNINDGINNWQTYQNLATLSVVDGRLRSTADDAGNAAYIGQWGNWNRPVGTKFYIVYHICGNKPGIANIGLVHDSFFTIVHPKIKINVTTSLTRHSHVITSSELTIGGIRFSGTDYTSPGDYIEIDNVLCVDLTALFGIGNEPSKEVMDMILFANENGLIEPDDILLVDKIRSTVQSVIFNNGMIEQIQHKSGDLIIRQDEFTFTDNSVTEKRSIPTGESITFINHLDTFEMEVI